MKAREKSKHIDSFCKQAETSKTGKKWCYIAQIIIKSINQIAARLKFWKYLYILSF